MAPDPSTNPVEEFTRLIASPYDRSLLEGEDPKTNPNLTEEFSEHSFNKGKLYTEIARFIINMWKEVNSCAESHEDNIHGLMEEGAFSFFRGEIQDASTYSDRDDLIRSLEDIKDPREIVCFISTRIATTLLCCLTLAKEKSHLNSEVPEDDLFSIAQNTLIESKLPNQRATEARNNLAELINQGINTAIISYRNFVILGFDVAIRDKDKFPAMNQEEFTSFMKAMMNFPLKIVSKHLSALAQVKALSSGDYYHGIPTINPTYFDLVETQKGMMIGISDLGRSTLKAHADHLIRGKMYAKKIGCPIQTTEAAITKEFHQWMKEIYSDLVIPRLWKYYNENS